jgi:hypothetical protein
VIELVLCFVWRQQQNIVTAKDTFVLFVCFLGSLAMHQTTYDELVRFLSTSANAKERWPASVAGDSIPYAERKSKKANFRKKAAKFVLQDGELWQQVGEKLLLVIPATKLSDFLQEQHGARHHSASRMIKSLKEVVYWNNGHRFWYHDVRQFVKDCAVCKARHKRTNMDLSSAEEREETQLPAQPVLPIHTRVWVRDPQASQHCADPFRLPARIFRIKANGTYRLLWENEGGYFPHDRSHGPSERWYSAKDLITDEEKATSLAARLLEEGTEQEEEGEQQQQETDTTEERMEIAAQEKQQHHSGKEQDEEGEIAMIEQTWADEAVLNSDLPLPPIITNCM